MRLEDLSIRRATADQIIALRHGVLRTGLPLDAARFAEDDDPATLHFGAFAGERNIACVTLLNEPFNGAPAWRLRGMATHPACRDRGIGSRLLQFAEQTLHQQSAHAPLWCDARIKAHRFYLRHGWTIASKQFIVPGVGLHYKMTKHMDITPPRIMLDDLAQTVRDDAAGQ